MPEPRQEPGIPPWQRDAERFITLQCRARSRSDHVAAARAGERVFVYEPVRELAVQIACSWRCAGDHRRAMAWIERARNLRGSPGTGR